MHSRFVPTYAGYGDLATATCVAAPPPLSLSLFRLPVMSLVFVWLPRVARFNLLRLVHVLWTSYHALVAGQM